MYRNEERTDPGDRAVAWGDELVKLHDRFRADLAELRRGVRTGRSLHEHCLTFCDALHAHHAGEDDVLFPHLDQTRPGMAQVLDRLRAEHRTVALLLEQIRAEPATGALERLATELEAHLDYEEEQLVPLLNAMTDLPDDL